jgi:hypothetical protein
MGYQQTKPIHAGTKLRTLIASISDNRTYRTKAFHNQLPTQNIMKQRMPNIYPDENGAATKQWTTYIYVDLWKRQKISEMT